MYACYISCLEKDTTPNKEKIGDFTKEHKIHLNLVMNEILRNQFFRKPDFAVAKYDCLLDVCDNLVKQNRKRQEDNFRKMPYGTDNSLKDEVNTDVVLYGCPFVF